jgi:uncharacterized membrane protein YfcA
LTSINAIFFFLIALVYSSAGFGGGSLYLALLSGMSGSTTAVRFVGLACNTVVTGVGSVNFQWNKWIAWRQLLPLLMCSVPFCIWSSFWKLEAKTYFISLGICLLIAGVLMLIKPTLVDEKKEIRNRWWLYPVSSLIGFISGLTGIGGGVYLSPLLHLVGWGSAKHISAASAVFILINSIAGLFVQYYFHDARLGNESLWLLIAVLLGGVIGSRLGSSLLSQRVVKLITAIIIIFAAVRILIRYL